MAREDMETVTTGRAKRSTAGNRMRELLQKAQQEDEDELFKEVEDDEDFTAPQDVRDVFLDEFADTDEEVEMDEEETERQMLKEERRKAKGKSKAIYNPLASARPSKPSMPTSKPILSARPHPSSHLPSSPGAGPSTAIPGSTLLASGIDPSTMAPSTLVLAMRKERREAKRAQRSEARRSTMRASTLKSQLDLAEKERLAELAKAGTGEGEAGDVGGVKLKRKGRKAQHEGGEVRGTRPLTQAELIEQALEEEERNKEALKDWLKKEEEKRELRRVGRKVVRGPKWTWVSRTVGRLVEEVKEVQVEVSVPIQMDQNTSGEERKGELVVPGREAKSAGVGVDVDMDGVGNIDVGGPPAPTAAPQFSADATPPIIVDADPTATSVVPAVPPLIQPVRLNERAHTSEHDHPPAPETPPTGLHGDGNVTAVNSIVMPIGGSLASWGRPDEDLPPSSSAASAAAASASAAAASAASAAAQLTSTSVLPQAGAVVVPLERETPAKGQERVSASASTSIPVSGDSETGPSAVSAAAPPSAGTTSHPQAPTQETQAAGSTTPTTSPPTMVSSFASMPEPAPLPAPALALAPGDGTAVTVPVISSSVAPSFPASARTQALQPGPAAGIAAPAPTPRNGAPDMAFDPSAAAPIPAPNAHPPTAAASGPLRSTLAGQRSDTAVGVGASQATAPNGVPASVTPQSPATAAAPAAAAAPATAAAAAPSTGPYTRNYIILSKVPGGLAGEMRLILGDHVDWDQVQYVPTRARPLRMKTVFCPITGLPAKYRHPSTNVPYATAHAYKMINALMAERYVYSADLGAWMGAEDGEHAEGVMEVEGWEAAVHGGWNHGRRIGEEVADQQQDGEVEDDGAGVGEQEEGEDGAGGEQVGEVEDVKPDVTPAKGSKGSKGAGASSSSKGKAKAKAAAGAGKRKRDSVVTTDSPVTAGSKSKKGRKSLR